MKILIVQLSDMHCKQGDEKFTSKLEKALDALKTLMPIDRILLIFSGDLANTGNENEYIVARGLIGKFLSDMGEYFKCGYIHLKLVPGNHDICLSENCRTADEIVNWDRNTHLKDEISKMDPFFKYANSKKCFKDDKIVENDLIEFDNIKIQVCSLNSAPYSTRTPTDKELHYLPNYVSEKINRISDVDLKITIMHHHYEWCEWDSKEMLKKAIASDDITFFGHDHKSETIYSEYSNGYRYNIVMGGEFNLHLHCPASFNAVIFDSKKDILQSYEFEWSVSEEIFHKKSSREINKKKSDLILKQTYLDELLRDEQSICDNFLDYYVLPKLTADGDEFLISKNLNNTLSLEDVFNLLKNNNVVKIIGNDGSGKSALLKYLYVNSPNFGYLPLLVENRDYRNSDIDKMFRDLFEEQYELVGEHTYDKYNQIDNYKIIFIDNLDLIKNEKAKQSLINKILESGKLLIYTTKDKNQDLEEIVKDMLQKKRMSTIDINPIYKQIRDDLVEKIGKIYNKTNDEISSIKMSLDYLAQSQTNLFSFTPANTIQYIKYFVNSSVKERQSNQTMSLVFETNIRNEILSSCNKDYTANKYLLVLEHVAKSMYFSLHAEVIDQTVFRSIVEDYNHKKRGDINEKNFLDCCINARILQEVENSFSIRFLDKNTYAYFVAKALNRDFEKNRNDIENLRYVLEHICFGINDTILLFLSFIRNNTEIITKIATEALNLLEDYPEWDFMNENLPFMHQIDGSIKNLPSEKERKEAHKYIEKVEQEKHKQIQFRNIFDYDENDVNKSKYLIMRALKYTQLTARALIDQDGALENDEIDMILKTIYIVPLKAIYAILSPLQDNYNEVIQNMLEFVKQENLEGEITESDIRKLFGQVGSCIALGVLNDVAFNCSNESTILILRSEQYQKANYKILRLMMEENSGNTNEFISKSISLYKEWSDNLYGKFLISKIAQKHIVYTSNVEKRQIDKLLSNEVLSAREKKSLLLAKEIESLEKK